MDVMLGDDAEGMRLDRFVRKMLGSIGQGALERQLRRGKIRLDGAKVKANMRLQSGQVLSYPDMLFAADKPGPLHGAAPMVVDQQTALSEVSGMIVAEHQDWLVLNKIAGLAVQGGSQTRRHIDGLLRAAYPDAPPKLVHRLDKDTTGLLLVARHVKAARALTKEFAGKTMQKVYLALVIGDPGPAGLINAPLRKAGGKGAEKMVVDYEVGQSARTEFLRLKKAEPVSLVALKPITGRTHQLRVHMANAGTPILGDGKYAGAAAHIDNFSRQLHLHARFLRLSDGTILSADLSPHFKAAADMAGLAEYLPDVFPIFGLNK